MLVAMVFGLEPSWGMLTVPFIGFVAGYGWACFGISIAGVLKSIDNFTYITSTVITPLFLLAGTFFPISGLPEWAQVLAQFNPLYHCVQLVRHAVFGFQGWVDVWNWASSSSSGWRCGAWRSTRCSEAGRLVEVGRQVRPLRVHRARASQLVPRRAPGGERRQVVEPEPADAVDLVVGLAVRLVRSPRRGRRA